MTNFSLRHCALAVIVAAVMFTRMSTRAWLMAILPWSVVLVAFPLIVPRLPSYRRTDQYWQEIQRRYPSLVAEFQRVD